MVSNQTARTAERWPGRRPAGTLPEIPRGSDSTGQRTVRRWRPRWRPSPWVPWRRGRRNCCPVSPAATRSPASRPQRTRRRHPSRQSSYTSSRRRCWRTAGRASSTTTARRRLREAYKGRSAMHSTRGTPHSAGAPASGMRAAAHPLPGLSLWFMIAGFIGCFNDILTEGNGKSMLFKMTKQNHTGQFRHGIHEVGDGDLFEYHFPSGLNLLRYCCFLATSAHPLDEQAFDCSLGHVKWCSTRNLFVLGSHSAFDHRVARRQLDECSHWKIDRLSSWISDVRTFLSSKRNVLRRLVPALMHMPFDAGEGFLAVGGNPLHDDDQ